MEKTTYPGSLTDRSALNKLMSSIWSKKKLLVEIIAHLFIILFLYTGLAKLMEFDVFQEQLSESPILGRIATFIAFTLPITEFVISILLFLPKLRLIGMYMAFSLMLLFTAYVTSILLIDQELPCSCGGIIEALSWEQHLILNIVLIVLSFSGIVILKKVKKETV